MREKTGNVRIAKKRGRRFCGESATDAHAVNHPITNTKKNTPKKKFIAAESRAPLAMRTKSAKKLKSRMNATDIPVRIAKKLSKSRSEGCRIIVLSHGNRYVCTICQPPVAQRRS